MALYGSASGFTVTLSESVHGYYWNYDYPDDCVQYSINGGNYIKITSLNTNIILNGVKTIQFKAGSTDRYWCVGVGITKNYSDEIVQVVNDTEISSVITLTKNITYYCKAN